MVLGRVRTPRTPADTGFHNFPMRKSYRRVIETAVRAVCAVRSSGAALRGPRPLALARTSATHGCRTAPGAPDVCARLRWPASVARYQHVPEAREVPDLARPDDGEAA